MSVTLVYQCDDCDVTERVSLAERRWLATPKDWHVWLDGAVYLHACPACAPARRKSGEMS